MTDVSLCAGDSIMDDDGVGPLLAERCVAAPKSNWVVIGGGSVSKNDIIVIHELRPTRLPIIDTADMGLNPGGVRIVNPNDIAEMLMIATYSMPLNYLIDRLKEDIGGVIFLGIQPDIVSLYYSMTQPTKDAAGTVYQRLESQEGDGGSAQLVTEVEQFSIKELRGLSIGTRMCTFLSSLVLSAQATSFAEYLPMSGNEYAQERALKPPLTMPYDAE